MIRFHWKDTVRIFKCVIGISGVLTFNAMAQYGGPSGGGRSGGSATGGGPTSVYNFHGNYHLGFDTPEAWGLKYFASTTLLSGLPAPEPPEGHRVGSLSVGFELGWLPTLDAG